jgi:hypothetical protein
MVPKRKTTAGGGAKVTKQVKTTKREEDPLFVQPRVAAAAFQELGERIARGEEPLRTSARTSEVRINYADGDGDDDDDASDDATTVRLSHNATTSIQPTPPRASKSATDRSLERMTDTGKPEDAAIRSEDAQRLHRLSYVYVSRYFNLKILPLLEDGDLPSVALWDDYERLLTQGYHIAAYAMKVVGAPLSPISIFEMTPYSTSGPDDPRDRALRVTRTGAIQLIHSDWVVNLNAPVYFRHGNGYLNNASQRMWIDEILQPVQQRIEEVLRFVALLRDPDYAQTGDEGIDLDLGPDDHPDDSDDDSALGRHADRWRSRITFTSRSRGGANHGSQSRSSTPRQDAGSSTNAAQLAMSAWVSPITLAPGLNAACSTGTDSVSIPRSVSTLEDMQVTEAEMQEPWLRMFGDVSLLDPNARQTDSKARAFLIEKCPMLKSLDPVEVLRFLEYLAKAAGQSLNVAFPWVQVITPELIPAILGSYEQCFAAQCLENLADVNPRKLVKVLGRLCEVKHWSAFLNKTKPLFKQFVWQRADTQDLQWVWQQVQAVIYKLTLVIPFFGRRVGRGGGTLATRQSTFANLFADVVPDCISNPMLDRVYSPAYAEMNVDFGLHEDPARWDFADYAKLLRVLTKQATIAAQEDRKQMETRLEYNNMADKFSKPVRAHALNVPMEDLETFDTEDAPEDSFLLSLPPGASVARNKAYGGSGSGQPSERLNKVIERSADRATKPSFCFKHVLYGDCPRGNECVYPHPRPDQWTAEHVSFVQAENAKRAERSRDDGPRRVPVRHHNLEQELEAEAQSQPIQDVEPAAAVGRLKDD